MTTPMHRSLDDGTWHYGTDFSYACEICYPFETKVTLDGAQRRIVLVALRAYIGRLEEQRWRALAEMSPSHELQEATDAVAAAIRTLELFGGSNG